MIIKNIKDALEEMSSKYLEACKTGTISEIKDIDKELSEILALFKDVTKTDVTLDLVDIKSLKEELLLSIEKVNGFYNTIQLKLTDEKLRGRPGKDSIAVDGNDGYTPIKDKDYFDGKDGEDGKDGIGIDGKDGEDADNNYNNLLNKPTDYTIARRPLSEIVDFVNGFSAYFGGWAPYIERNSAGLVLISGLIMGPTGSGVVFENLPDFLAPKDGSSLLIMAISAGGQYCRLNLHYNGNFVLDGEGTRDSESWFSINISYMARGVE